MNQRLHGLDFLRALMMLLGIVLHGAQMYMNLGLGFDYYKDPARSPSMDATLIFINTFRMPVFFFLSGFFTALLYQRYQLDGMIRNRLARIALPFVIFLPPLAVVLDLQWIAGTQLAKTGAVGLDASYLDNPELLWNNTHHLWFLYYLMIILAAFTAIIWLFERLPESLKSGLGKLGNAIPAHSVLLVILAGVVVGTLAMDRWTGRINGGILFTPHWTGVYYFSICFLAGWAVWYRRSCLKTLEKRCWIYLLTACLCFGAALAGFLLQGPMTARHHGEWHALLALGNGLSVAFFVVGLTGLFSRYFSNFNPWIRYISDSAYWTFLLHQSVLLLLAMPMYSWQVPAELKFLIVCLGTLFFCTVSYHYLVRSTAIGALLNGRRYTRALPSEQTAGLKAVPAEA